MPVSHPLAAGDSHGNAGYGAPAADRRDRGLDREAGPDVSTAQTPSRSILAEQVVIAPERLGLESRVEFREVASKCVDRVTPDTGRLVIDCRRVASIDSAGLNALILVHRKAAQRRIGVCLRGLDKELLALLVLTKLDDLFELQDG